MSSYDKLCGACGGSKFRHRAYGYIQCESCGLERREMESSSVLVNEELNLQKVLKLDLRDRFQLRVVSGCARSWGTLIDIGCGPGRFLNHAKFLFKRVCGVEVTEPCILFAQSQLGLEVVDQADKLNLDRIDVATFWHSLEHIGERDQENILNFIRCRLSLDGRVVVSVPNCRSVHWSIFGASSVFFDRENHLFQFTAQSLDLKLKQFNFERESHHTSLMYSWVGHALSLVNLLTGRHNFLYKTLRRGAAGAPRTRLAIHLAIFIVSIPLTLPLFLFDCFFPQRGAVLTAVFRLGNGAK